MRPSELHAGGANFMLLFSGMHFESVLSSIRHGFEADRAKLLHSDLNTDSFVSDLPRDVKSGLWIQLGLAAGDSSKYINLCHDLSAILRQASLRLMPGVNFLKNW